MIYHSNEPRMFADITDGTAIIINSSTGVYYGLNHYGTTIYDNLVSGCSPEDIIKAVEDLPGVPEGAAASIRSFVDTLVGFEIVVPEEDGSGGTAAIDLAAAKTDSFIPECKEFHDIQDLLFADPIHEVDADEGWKPEK